jgi:hypothetical protein
MSTTVIPDDLDDLKLNLSKPVSNPDTRGPFINKIKLNRLVKYDDIKDFPIWWSGFYVNNPELNDIINGFDTKGEFIASEMMNASQFLKGFTDLEVRNYIGFEDDIKENTVTLVTTPDSLISIDESLLTNRSINSITSSARSTARKAKSRNDIRMPRMKRGEVFSAEFTKLALLSKPKNIGLFVNCETQAEFVKKIFYKIEFNIIINWYQKIKQNVKIYIFNLQKNCFNITKVLEEKVEKVLKEKLEKQLKKTKKKLKKNTLPLNKYITFECFNCDNLIDCARIINQRIKNAD